MYKMAKNLLEELISVNTENPRGNEAKAAEVIKMLLEAHGISANVQDLGGGRGNLLASFGNDEGPSLLLDGHLDVVVAEGKWKHEPFKLTEEEGRFYGRGTSDMKGGVAAMCAAAIKYKEEHPDIKGRVKMLFVADEENANYGTLNCPKEFMKSDFAIIGEPTELNIQVAHRGVARDYIEFTYPSRHAALYKKGDNSVIAGAKGILALDKLNEKLSLISHEILPSPSVSITKIEGYEQDNTVPGKVRILTDYRILPGTCYEDVRKNLDSALMDAGIKNYEIKPHFFMEGGETDPRCEFVQNMCSISRGKCNAPEAFDASCEQVFLVKEGIETIICGPGSLKQAHTVDEFMEADQLYRACDFYYDAMGKVFERR